MARPKVPSKAQARYLAWLFSEQKIVDFVTIPPTIAATIREGWLSPCGEIEQSSGAKSIQFQISPAGLGALERYLWNIRVNALTPALSSQQGK